MAWGGFKGKKGFAMMPLSNGKGREREPRQGKGKSLRLCGLPCESTESMEKYLKSNEDLDQTEAHSMQSRAEVRAHRRAARKQVRRQVISSRSISHQPPPSPHAREKRNFKQEKLGGLAIYDFVLFN